MSYLVNVATNFIDWCSATLRRLLPIQTIWSRLKKSVGRKTQAYRWQKVKKSVKKMFRFKWIFESRTDQEIAEYKRQAMSKMILENAAERAKQKKKLLDELHEYRKLKQRMVDEEIAELKKRAIDSLNGEIRLEKDRLQKELENERERIRGMLDRVELECHDKKNFIPFQQKLNRFIKFSETILAKLKKEYGTEKAFTDKYFRFSIRSYFQGVKEAQKLHGEIFEWVHNDIDAAFVRDPLKDIEIELRALATERQQLEDELAFEEAYILNFRLIGYLESLVYLKTFFADVEELIKNFASQPEEAEDNEEFEVFFELLGIRGTNPADFEIVRKAYLRAVKNHHSDNHPEWDETERLRHTGILAEINTWWGKYKTQYTP